MMKRILIFFLIVSTSALFYGFRGAGYRADRTSYGTVDIIDASLWIKGDTLFFTDGGADTSHIVQDGSNLSFSSDNVIEFNQIMDVNNKSMWIKGDSLFFTDGGADTSFIVQQGTYLVIGSDNSLYFGTSAYMSTSLPISDTMSYMGAAANRWKEVWAKRHMGTDGTKADTFKIYDDGDTTRIASDNPIKIEGVVVLGDDGTTQTDSLQIGGGDVLIKIVKVGSHLAIILSGADTLWAAADTTGF